MHITMRNTALLFASAGLTALLAFPAAAQTSGASTVTGTTNAQTDATGANQGTYDKQQEPGMQSTPGMTPSTPNTTTNNTPDRPANPNDITPPPCDTGQMHSGTSTTTTNGMISGNCPDSKIMRSTPPNSGSAPGATSPTPP